MNWTKNGEEIFPLNDTIIINCQYIKLPVFTNFNENSEISLLWLYEIYDSICNSYDNVLLSHKRVLIYSDLPHSVVEELNSLSRILRGYLISVGVNKYLPNINWVNMNPKSTTPECEYFICGIKEQKSNIEKFLSDREITRINNVPVDTDWN